MKARYKALILFVIIVISAIAFYLYRLDQYMKLNPEDRTIIEKAFGKDSDGKGYSDEGHRLMMEDLSKVQMTDQEISEFRKLYQTIMIHKRKTAMSANQQEFLINEKEHNELHNCWVRWSQKNKNESMTFNFFHDNSSMGDDPALNDYLDILFSKYLRNLSREEKNEIVNPKISLIECRKFL